MEKLKAANTGLAAAKAIAGNLDMGMDYRDKDESQSSESESDIDYERD